MDKHPGKLATTACLKQQISLMPEADDTDYQPFLLGNDPDLSEENFKAATQKLAKPNLLFVGTGGLYSLILALKLQQEKSHKGALNIVILDSSEKVMTMWGQFQKKIADCREKFMLGGAIETLIPNYNELSRQVEKLERYERILCSQRAPQEAIDEITQQKEQALKALNEAVMLRPRGSFNFGHGYTDQDPDAIADTLLKLVPGKGPAALDNLKTVVANVLLKRVSWSSKDLFKGIGLPGTDLVFYPSNIGPCLNSDTELAKFNQNIKQPGSLVISSNLGPEGKPTEMFATFSEPSATADYLPSAADTETKPSTATATADTQPLAAEAESFFLKGGDLTLKQKLELEAEKADSTQDGRQDREVEFQKRFKETYRGGFLGGHWGNFWGNELSEAAARSYGARNPKSATAKAIKLLDASQ